MREVYELVKEFNRDVIIGKNIYIYIYIYT